MEKLNKYKRWNLQLHFHNDLYWDFVLSQDATPYSDSSGVSLKNEDCLAAYIDFSDSGCVDGTTVVSLPEYAWANAVSEPDTLKDFGFVAMDNGRLIFDYSTATNKEFYEAITGTTLELNGDKRLHLCPVSGNTKEFIYPAEYNEDGYYSFNGGFLQGFYKVFGFKYDVLPQYIENEWNLEFVLRPRKTEEHVKTINSKNGGKNKGIFFYMGTRAENKFAEFYDANLDKYPDRSDHKYCDDDYFAFDWDDGESTENKFKAEFFAFLLLSPFNCSCKTPCIGCSSYSEDDTYKQLAKDCDLYFSDGYFQADEKTEEVIKTSDGAITKKGGYHEIDTDNKFLTYDRTKDGLTVDTDKGEVVKLYYYEKDWKENKFLTYHRAKGGKTVDTETDTPFKYSVENDIKNNAFALRITEDGRIGYRYLISDCEKDFEIIEEYSNSGMVLTDEWNVVTAKITAINGNTDECGTPLGQRKICIFIYVNGRLVFISKELPDFNFKELDDIYAKQETVPFNISLGGGTQGLCEAIGVDTKLPFNKILPLEDNFAGTFIGDIKSFKFFTCSMSFPEIRNNYLYEKTKLQWEQKNQA